MQKQRIKVDLSSYLGLEQNVNFRAYQDKVFSIISNLYSSKSNTSAMAGWLNLPHDENMISKIKSYTEKIISEEKYEHLLVFGIGGSTLGAQALTDAVNSPLWNRLSKGKRKGYLTIDFIDNLDPQIIRNILSRLKLSKTLFLVISKGGDTIETILPMLIAKEWFGGEKGNFYSQCVFITTEGRGLLFDLAKKNNVPVFSIPEGVGGRYSVFSPVGLLPASLCGLNLDEIKAGLVDADTMCQEQDLKNNISVLISLCSFFSYQNGKNIFVLMPYSTCLRRFADWFVQLFSESLGKQGKGPTPVLAIGASDQHAQMQLFNEGPNDKLICFLKINKHKRDVQIPDYTSEDERFKLYGGGGHKVGQVLNTELDSTRRALTERSRANLLITLPELDEYYLSKLMYVFQVSVAISGHLLGVNPFDQPSVELAKKYTKEALLQG